jgi:excinuclease UvrABC helicase subunit UvrB
MPAFQIVTTFTPQGDQPQAIEKLSRGLLGEEKHQVLLGVTGSGKTFTMAHVIERVQKPTLVIAPNKTLAAWLHSSMENLKNCFPTMLLNILSVIMTTTSLKPICPPPTPTLPKMHPSTTPLIK